MDNLIDNFWFWYALLFISSVFLVYMFGDSDSSLNKKRFDNKVWNIGFVCRLLNIKELNFENKNFQFSVRVEDKRDYEYIRYCSPYNTTSIYVNDELVCKLHRLENNFIKSRTIEYTKNRNTDEIREIILKAYKVSKKKENEYYTNKLYREHKNTFYK